jgi:hypothetical protein
MRSALVSSRTAFTPEQIGKRLCAPQSGIPDRAVFCRLIERIVELAGRDGGCGPR